MASLGLKSLDSMAAAAQTDVQNGSRDRITFFALPAEIRNQIYEYSLIESEPIVLDRWSPYIVEPPLLFTNKQVHREALPIFYGSNVFRSGGTQSIARFLELTDSTKLALIKSLQVVPKGHLHSITTNIFSGACARGPWDPMGDVSWRLCAVRILLPAIRDVAQWMVQTAKRNGLKREAILLPIWERYWVDEVADRWIPMEEHKYYDPEEKEDGSIWVVKLI